MAGEKGEATKTRAVVSIQNAVPGGEHLWHVHLGQCGDDRGIFGPADAWYKDVESARLFNRYAALGALGVAAIYALREALGSRRAST